MIGYINTSWWYMPLISPSFLDVCGLYVMKYPVDKNYTLIFMFKQFFLWLLLLTVHFKLETFSHKILRGVRKLTEENLKLVWAEFSTLS